jgi:hypothetical protein
MRKRLRFAMITGLLAPAAALAQVPTSDVARQVQENCIQTHTTSEKATSAAAVPSDQGIQTSNASPGAATGAPTASVGSGDLTGGAGSGLGSIASAGDASSAAGSSSSIAAGGSSVSTPSLGGTTSGGLTVSAFNNVGGINMSSLVGVSGSGFNVGTLVQAITAGAAVTSALQGNSGTLTGAGAIVGTIDSSHGGWDQNSAARVAQTANWNQVTQAFATAAQMKNLMLMLAVQSQSASATVFKSH